VKDCDIVFDTQGGEILERCFQSAKRGGIVVTVGGVPDAKYARAMRLNPLVVLVLGFMTRRITRLSRETGVRFEYLFMRARANSFQRSARCASRGPSSGTGPNVSFEQAKEAFAYSETGRAIRKVVIEIDKARGAA